MKRFASVILVLLLAFFISGCTNSKSSVAPKNDEVKNTETKKDVKRFTIGTAGTAGSLYPMGVGMAQTITDNVKGFAATGESTAASIENLRNLHEGVMGLGISQSEIAYYAYNGINDYDGNAYKDIRALFSTIYSYLQIFTLEENDITNVLDLKGKTIGVGKAGSGGEMAARSLLKTYGLDYKSVNAQFMSESDAVSALKDKKIDAFIATHPIGSAPLTELVTSAKAKLIPIENESFYSEYPAYTKYILKGGTYSGIEKDVQIPRGRIIMCTSTNSDFTEDDIYNIVKAIWENRSEWASVSNAVEKQVLIETALEEISIPLHKGAIKYYEEIGIKVPSTLKE